MWEKEHVHIDSISPGDIIINRNKMMTVCAKDIKHSDFMGTTLFGDSYKRGHEKVTRLSYKLTAVISDLESTDNEYFISGEVYNP